jgi:hypothetical protein
METNTKEVNFLDVTLNLNTGKYTPYRKPSNPPLYINRQSNHPPNIIKQMPKIISKHLSDVSTDEAEFRKAKDDHGNALKNSGFHEQITFERSTKKGRTRTRRIIWFNPPFNSAVETDIGRKFLNLIGKHFTKEHKYCRIFNRNTLKLSYSCMPNMKTIISGHNKKLLRNDSTNLKINGQCNCRNPEECPLDKKCLAQAIVYKASVTTSIHKTPKVYFGATELPFKFRFRNHEQSFKNPNKRNDTQLAKHIWELKEKGSDFQIKWEIQRQCSPYQCGSRRCDLCLSEKYVILLHNDRDLLNKRSELMSSCRHRAKFKMKTL